MRIARRNAASTTRQRGRRLGISCTAPAVDRITGETMTTPAASEPAHVPRTLNQFASSVKYARVAAMHAPATATTAPHAIRANPFSGWLSRGASGK
jgi:hypothetical protein